MSLPNFAGNVEQSDSFALVPLVLIPMNIDDFKQFLSEFGQLVLISSQEFKELKEQIKHLEMLIRTKDEKIQELECLQNHYSNDGDAICNSEF